MKKVGSGKQILNLILKQLSTKFIDEKNLEDASERLRAGLLVRASTAEETFDSVSKLSWKSAEDEGEIYKQGIAISNGKVFIEEFFHEIMEFVEVSDVKRKVLNKYTGLDEKDYEAGRLAIWAIISSVQMYTELLPVECNEKDIDLEKWIESMTRHYNYHMESKEVKDK